MKKFKRAVNALKKLNIPVFERDGKFFLSAEYPESYAWVNYYADSRIWGGEKINPKLRQVLEKCGMYLEWENPDCLSIYEI
jgi:hypothetical protein